MRLERTVGKSRRAIQSGPKSECGKPYKFLGHFERDPRANSRSKFLPGLPFMPLHLLYGIH